MLCTVDSYDVWRCPACACDFVFPVPTEEQLKTLYDREEWFEGGERGGYVTYDAQTEASPPWLQGLLEKVAAGVDGTPSILDIGCAYGTHLDVARQHRWQCFGVEPSDHARTVAAARHPEIYFTDTVANLPPHRFNLILMLEVIEHISDPYRLFYELFSRDHIGPETVIVMTTPNARSHTATRDAAQWEFRHPPSHLLFYSAKAFETLLRRLRFTTIEVAGQHKLADGTPEAGYGDERWDINDAIADQAGLLIQASGSDFAAFMQERFVPGTWSELTTYEHLPRYRYAHALAEGRRVLDFGSGTGYGSALLAEVAESVTALDIDDGALGYAREIHQAPNLRFEKEAALGRSLPDASFELIVCFEVIEHLSADDQKVLIEQFSRLITPDGIVVISTPNPDVTKRYGDNPYHLHEMSFEEFTARLSEYFEVVKPLYQHINAAISLSAAASVDSTYDVLPLERVASNDAAAFLALCSHTPFQEPRDIIYRDHAHDLIADRTTALRRNNNQLIELYQERTKAQAYIEATRKAEKRAEELASKNRELENELGQLIAQLEAEHAQNYAESEAHQAQLVAELKERSAALLAQFEPDRQRLQDEVEQHGNALEVERAAIGQFRHDIKEADRDWTKLRVTIVEHLKALSAAQHALSELEPQYRAATIERLTLSEHVARLEEAHIAERSALQAAGLRYEELRAKFIRLEEEAERGNARQAELGSNIVELNSNYTALLSELGLVQGERNILHHELHQLYTSTSWRVLRRSFPYLRLFAPVAKPPLRALAKIYRAWTGLSRAPTPVAENSAAGLAGDAGESPRGLAANTDIAEHLLVATDVQRTVQVTADQVDVEWETNLEPVWSEAEGAYLLRKRGGVSEGSTNDNRIGPYVLRPKYKSLLSRRSKVLHVIPNVYVGGSTQLIIDIVEHLGDQFDHVVLTSALWPGGEHEGIVVYRRRWDELISVPELLMEIAPDLVHMHYWGLTDDPWYDAILQSMDVLPRVKIVENINTPIPPKLHPRINHLVYVSDYVRREFHPPIASLDATSIVHPGIDLSAFDTPFSGDDAENAIGMVYRLEGDKLSIDAIEPFIRVAQLRPRTRIYIVGGGTFLEPYIRRTAEAGVRNNFCFTGYRPYAELPGWYDKFCMFVAPVWKESFGQVSPFGMAKQQVVAGYDVGALEEIIGTKEHLADDVEALARKIVDLLDDPVRRSEIGRYNRDRATAMFDVHSMVAEYSRIYGELLTE